MLVVMIRTIILYAAVLSVMRMMGKREIGQLQPLELVVALMIADLAAIPMQNTGIPLLSGLIPIIVLMAAQITLSYISIKNDKAREIISGYPSVVIENGKLVEPELRRLRYGIDDLLEQLRGKNYTSPADVEFAILETNGQLSVIPKSQKRPLQPADLQLDTKYEGIPLTVILDGVVETHNLRKMNLDKEWLRDEMHKFGVDNFKQVFYASISTTGELYFQIKEQAAGGGRDKT
ncbi:MAG: DUF421 domain-containing protein [Firmicutes bacterium]|nr:DUF421 domain-containing protein [Bacillota bacterium]